MTDSGRTWTFVNSDLGRLLLGFALTAVVGGFLTQCFQDRSWRKQREFEVTRETAQWERDKRFEMLRRKLDDGQQSLEEISDMMSTRLLRMRRIFAALRQNRVREADAEWPAYRDITDKWNVKLGIYQNKLRRLVSDSVARRFNNYETDNTAIRDPKAFKVGSSWQGRN